MAHASAIVLRQRMPRPDISGFAETIRSPKDHNLNMLCQPPRLLNTRTPQGAPLSPCSFIVYHHPGVPVALVAVVTALAIAHRCPNSWGLGILFLLNHRRGHTRRLTADRQSRTERKRRHPRVARARRSRSLTLLERSASEFFRHFQSLHILAGRTKTRKSNGQTERARESERGGVGARESEGEREIQRLLTQTTRAQTQRHRILTWRI